MSSNEFEDKVKTSFSNVKEDINELKNSYNLLKKEILALNDEIRKIYSLFEEKKKIQPEKQENIDPMISTPLTHSLTHSNTHSQNTQIEQYNLKELDQAFKNLAKREFLTFLAIYQLEEDLNHPVSYRDLSAHLKVTEEGIRPYVSNLSKKSMPIEKIRLKNKLVVLKITKEFRELNLKTRLIELYSQLDTEQTRLTDI